MHRPGGGGSGHHRDADVFEDLRHGGLARGAGVRAAGVFPEVPICGRRTAPSLASVSITSAAAANAALLDKDLVPLRRKINADNRSETLEFLTKRGYTILPGSQTNFFMVDVKRPGGEFQSAMLEENVAIGRTWASMPTYVRVSVGTQSEMARFQTAFVKCMDKAASSANGALAACAGAEPERADRADAAFA